MEQECLGRDPYHIIFVKNTFSASVFSHKDNYADQFSHKDRDADQKPGVHRIPYEYGLVYIGEAQNIEQYHKKESPSLKSWRQPTCQKLRINK